MSTGRVMDAATCRNLAGGFGNFGDAGYAEAAFDELESFGEYFRAELFRQGVTKWDPRFDCNHFASFYVALAQLRFYAANFQSWTSAQTLALGELWYRRDNGAGCHAVVIALTDSGVRFIDTQTQKFIAL